MLTKANIKSIIKCIKKLEFVDSVDENELELYENYDESDEIIEDSFMQVDFMSVGTDDRIEVMDDKKAELLKELLKEDKTIIPEVNVEFERMDAYPNGKASYIVKVYE